MSIVNDLKVLELASVLAGPGVGQFFAELGAEVIKVENLNTRGDITRTWKITGENADDRSAYFCSVNWGKKSIAVDLNSNEGQAIVHKLAKKSDIVIASYKPGDARKLKVDYKTLSALNPKLIYGQTTGYGSDNPRVGYDAVVQAEAGFMFMNGEPGGASLKMPVALVDILASHHLKEGLLLALLQRERTGKGDFVEVSLIQAAVSSLANQATNWLVAGKMPQKKGSAHPNIAPYGDVFRTSDNKEILLAVGSDRQFQDLCKLLDLSPIALTKEYQTNQSRVENRQSLNTLLQEKISRWTAIELMDSINKAKVPGGIIQNMQEVFQMPEVVELLIKGEQFSGVRTFAANSPSWKSEDLLPPPHFGEHTNEILRTI